MKIRRFSLGRKKTIRIQKKVYENKQIDSDSDFIFSKTSY